jgi:hypothetical protein
MDDAIALCSRGMTPNVWGPLMWSLLGDIAWNSARATSSSADPSAGPSADPSADPSACADGSGDTDTSPLRRWLAEALPLVLPCVHCRDSFGAFVKKDSPLLPSSRGHGGGGGRGPELVAWVYRAKRMVNDKLFKQRIERLAELSPSPQRQSRKDVDTAVGVHVASVLTFPQFVQRMIVSDGRTLEVHNMWDLLFIFALNYPSCDTVPQCREKRRAYVVFMTDLACVLAPLRHMQDLVLVLTERPPRPERDIGTRKRLLAYLYDRYLAWHEIAHPSIQPPKLSVLIKRYLAGETGALESPIITSHNVIRANMMNKTDKDNGTQMKSTRLAHGPSSSHEIKS